MSDTALPWSLSLCLIASAIMLVVGITKNIVDASWQHKCVDAGVAEFYIGDEGQRLVCAWLGNSRAVAARHYLQVTEEDFESAAKCAATGGHNGPQPVTKNPASGP